jgi:hypothetical protein
MYTKTNKTKQRMIGPLIATPKGDAAIFGNHHNILDRSNVGIKEEVNAQDILHLETDKIKPKKEAAHRTEKEINLSHLKNLKAIFQQSIDLKTGCISSKIFSSTFGEVMGGMTEKQLTLLFMKIDANCDDLINWDEFSSYILMRSEGQKSMKEQGDSALVEEESNLKRHVPTNHKEMIVRVCDSYWFVEIGLFTNCPLCADSIHQES